MSLSFRLCVGVIVRMRVQPFTAIPPGWRWLYWANPVAHAFRAMVPPQFYCNFDVSTSCPTIIVPAGTSVAVVPTWSYVHSFYGFSYDDR